MKKLSALVLACLLLAACGGGSGGGVSTSASASKVDVKVGGKDSTLNVKTGAVYAGNSGGQAEADIAHEL